MVPNDALVYVLARTVDLGGVALGASTVAHSTGYRYALSTAGTLFSLRTASQHAFPIHDLVGRLTLALDAVAFFAKRERVPIESRRALALVAAR